MRIIVWALLLLYTTSPLRADESEFYKIKYTVIEEDTLISILQKFTRSESQIHPTSPMLQRTYKDNPHIKNWDELVPGEEIDLFIPQSEIDLTKYDEFVEQSKNRISVSPMEEPEISYSPEGLRGSLFYMASYGKFTQTDKETAKVFFTQNSPITLGTSLVYFLKNSHWSISSSAYYSYLLASANNLDDSKVSVPGELGANIYGDYRFVNHDFTGYFGLDYERFSTFNHGKLHQDNEILLDQNSVIYATIGFARLFEFMNHNFYTKISFSKSITSSITPHSEGFQNKRGYEGYKFMGYLNKKFTERLYLHTLFKYHKMTGASELTSMRIGLGLGYIFR